MVKDVCARVFSEKKYTYMFNKVKRWCCSYCVSQVQVIYQTRETVFHRDIETPRRELKYDAQRSIFDEIRGVWIADETLSRVFVYLLSETKTKQKNRLNIFPEILKKSPKYQTLFKYLENSSEKSLIFYRKKKFRF